MTVSNLNDVRDSRLKAERARVARNPVPELRDRLDRILAEAEALLQADIKRVRLLQDMRQGRD